MICIVVVVFSYLFALPFFDFPCDAFCSVAVFLSLLTIKGTEMVPLLQRSYCFVFISSDYSGQSVLVVFLHFACDVIRSDEAVFDASPSNGWTLMSLTVHDYHRSECLCFLGKLHALVCPMAPQVNHSGFREAAQWLIATLGSSLRETSPLFWRFLGRLSVIQFVQFAFSVFSSGLPVFSFFLM